uniref:Uncharacterized protein n=1 Tax=Anguilla anguilla TaxID=7936 RepID=A0A0E9SE21_ANGAN
MQGVAIKSTCSRICSLGYHSALTTSKVTRRHFHYF